MDDKPDSVFGRPFIYVCCCQHTFARDPFSFLGQGRLPKQTENILALARGGVYLAMLVTKHAVRSYRTISPLPVNTRVFHRRSTLCGTEPWPAIKAGGRYPPPCPTVSGLSSRFLRNPRPSVHMYIVRKINSPWVSLFYQRYTACYARPVPPSCCLDFSFSRIDAQSSRKRSETKTCRSWFDK